MKRTSKQQDRIQKWKRISSMIQKKQSNDELDELLKKLGSYDTKYQLVDMIIDRIEYLSGFLPSGNTDIPINTWIKIIEMDHDLLEFMEITREMDITIDQNEQYWKDALSHFFKEYRQPYMISYFLWKDLGHPTFIQEDPETVFWSLIRNVSVHLKPNEHWNRVLRPYIFDDDFVASIQNVHQKLKKDLLSKDNTLTSNQQDNIIFLGKEFYNRFLNQDYIYQDDEKIAFPIPSFQSNYVIPNFIGVKDQLSNLGVLMKKYLGEKYTSRFVSVMTKKPVLPLEKIKMPKSARIGRDAGTNVINIARYGHIKLVSNLLDAGISVEEINKL